MGSVGGEGSGGGGLWGAHGGGCIGWGQRGRGKRGAWNALFEFFGGGALFERYLGERG